LEYPRWVDERLPYSMCHICPLNGQRKVGSDGPIDAEFVGIFEAPGEDEEADRLTKGYKYGRPLQGKTGYFMRVRHLAKVGLQELLPPRPGYKSPRLGRLKIYLMNVAMCRSPKNKIDSPEGKKAVRCCANGARFILNKIIAANPNITLCPAGGTALSMLRGVKTPIEPYRGRFLVHGGEPFPYEDEREIEKAVLRGVKPQEEWWEVFYKWLKSFIKFYRSVDRALSRQQKKMSDALLLGSVPSLVEWSKLWKKQKASLLKAQKLQATHHLSESPGILISTAPRAPRRRKSPTETSPCSSSNTVVGEVGKT